MLYLPQRKVIHRPPLGAQLNHRNAYSEGLICAYLFTEGQGGKVKNMARPGWYDLEFGDTNATWKTASLGRTIDFASTGYLTSAMTFDDDFLGPMTISVRAMIRTGGAYQQFASKHSNNGASFNPFDFGTDNSNPQKIAFTRATSGVNQYRGWTSSGIVTLNTVQEYTATTPSNLIEIAPTIYINGVDVGATNTSGINSGPAGAGGAALRVGRRYDGVTQLDGVMYHVFIWKRYMGYGEVRGLVENPYQMFGSGGADLAFAAASAVNPSGGAGIESHASQFIVIG